MADDRHLLKKLRRGDTDALRIIYEKYKDDLLTVAMSFLGDINAAEDCLQDVFVWFAGAAADLNVRQNLKGYLLTCIANRARDRLRKKTVATTTLPDEPDCPTAQTGPAGQMIEDELSAMVFTALSQLPCDQREVIALRAQGGLTFREIAELQAESINTVQSRYRYGIKKLRTLLKKEYKNE